MPFFFLTFNFIHELKWLWAVTDQFFTVLWTDGCSKNISILAVSNRLDLPKQCCRHFIKSKEIKNRSRISEFLRVIKTQPVAVNNAGTRCIQGKFVIQPQRSRTSFWSAISACAAKPRPALQTQKRAGMCGDLPTSSPAHPALSRAAAMGFAHPKEKLNVSPWNIPILKPRVYSARAWLWFLS